MNRHARRREAALARRRHRRLSKPIVASVAAGAIGLGAALSQPQTAIAQTVGPPFAAPCVVSGTTVTCTGDVSDGIQVNPSVIDTLIVENVDPPGITPGDGIGGVDFDANDGDINIDVDTTGTAGIATTGDGAEGISAYVNGNGDVDIENTGNVTTDGGNSQGIEAIVSGSGYIDILNIGNITIDGSSSPGISALVANDGAIDISNTGDITADGFNADGIYAIAVDGDIAISNDGNLTTDGGEAEGVYALVSGNGYIDILNVGDITTDGLDAEGIYARMNGDGNIDVSSAGNIITNGNVSGGIVTFLGGDGDIAISNDGDVTTYSDNSSGIYTLVSGNGDIDISNDGNITTNSNGTNGVFAIAGNGSVSIAQNGRISAAIGVFALAGDDLDINVTGDISSDGFGAFAQSTYGSVEVQSTGDISTGGIALFAIATYGNVDIKSTGNITVTGGGSFAIFGQSLYESVDIQSTGDISAPDGTGIFGQSILENVEISNTGNIDVGGVNSVGISGSTSVGDVNIQNRGNISAGYRAISVSRGPTSAGAATITTSGILTGDSGVAVDLQYNGNDVVNLLPGTITNGAMDFGNGNDDDIDTLNFLPGLNATVDFADAGGFGQGGTDFESAPEIINFAGGGTVINNGLTAVAVDATGFAGQGTLISDITDAIFNIIDGNDAPAGAGSQSTSAFGKGDGSGSGDMRLWGSAFGGHHHLDGTASLAPFDHNFGGIATGFEKGDAATTGAFGGFAGYSYSNLQVDFNASDTKTDTGFLGGYWKRDYGSYRIHAAFAAGITDNDKTRTVNGIDAEGNFDGYFIAPSFTASAPLNLMGRPMSVSGRVTYVYMHLDDYTETGIALPLTVDSRDVSLFNLRAQLNVPHTLQHAGGNTSLINWSFGVDATVDAGSDDVNAIVAATPFVFAAETEDEAAAFIGFSAAHTSADGRRTMGIGGEVKSNFDGGAEALGEVRASFRF
ncbi:MAG: autotransporter domain-containing protein [Pseudomonadota bacterium]